MTPANRRRPDSHLSDDDVSGIRVLWTRPKEQPSAGMRVAWSYAVGFLVAVIAIPAGWTIANSLYNSNVVCKDSESFGCALVTIATTIGLLTALLLVVGGWWFRLGWRWGLVFVAAALGLIEIVVDPLSPWTLIAVVIPAIAALLTDPDPKWQRPRWWASLVLIIVTGGYLAAALVSAMAP
ncbi:MAG: hypothetical protein ACRCWS_09390 [Propionibacteriaceae bacterium]